MSRRPKSEFPPRFNFDKRYIQPVLSPSNLNAEAKAKAKAKFDAERQALINECKALFRVIVINEDETVCG